MGAIHFSVDLKLVQLLQKELSLTTFVETGTFEGDTILSVSPLFLKCMTVELSEEYFQKAKTRFAPLTNVMIEHADSASFLGKNQGALANEKVFYWLDAHWCVADKTAGELSQCPLLKELEAIKSLHPSSVILIDDARLYLCPPPQPHEISHWPSFGEILEKLGSLGKNHQLMVLNDVIIYYPREIDAALRAYAHKESIDFLRVLDKSKYYDELEAEIALLRKVCEERLVLINHLHEKTQTLETESKSKKRTWLGALRPK
jgi:hypothetical protein